MGAFLYGGATFDDNTTQTTKFDSSNEGGELLSITSFTTAGSFTWNRPSGCKKIVVRLVGAGGGAAGYCESGGSGGYSEKIIDVTNISSVAVTVGSGGGNVGYYAAAGNGGTTSFGTHCSASGGNGANQNLSHTGGYPGVGSGGDINLNGGMGTGHGNSMGHGALGKGGDSYFGGSTANNRASGGNAGTAAPGVGGSGGRTNESWPGGVGMPGAVFVWEYK